MTGGDFPARAGALAVVGPGGVLLSDDAFGPYVVAVLEAAYDFPASVSVRDLGTLLLLAMLVAVAGGLYRLDASLIAFMPGSNWSYFPSVVELTITLGFIALAILAYLYAVKRYTILPAPGSGVKTTS